MITLRRMSESDAECVARIQAASPEASDWKPSEYLQYESWVAEVEAGGDTTGDAGHVVGFLAIRATASGEAEVLNMAVDPVWRRRGVARTLLDGARLGRFEEVYLEVRESNAGAIRLYESLGFRRAGIRSGYYKQPVEAGIVMKLQKW